MPAKSLKFTVTGDSESPSKLLMSVREFSFTIDEPATFGGTNAGPNPVELVLSSLAGCINVVIHMVAAERNVHIRGLRLTVEGDLEPARLMGPLTLRRVQVPEPALA